MGTGKSVLGKRVAKKLGYSFVDSDLEIEKNEGMSIREIFDKFGEKKFRELEKNFIENGHPESGCVVSCGGGLVCRDDMPEILKKKGICVSLFSYPKEIFSRVSQSDDRPMLDSKDLMDRIVELLDKRTPFYMRSGVAIATDKKLSVTEDHILRIYRRKLKEMKSSRKSSARCSLRQEKKAR